MKLLKWSQTIGPSSGQLVYLLSLQTQSQQKADAAGLGLVLAMGRVLQLLWNDAPSPHQTAKCQEEADQWL